MDRDQGGQASTEEVEAARDKALKRNAKIERLLDKGFQTAAKKLEQAPARDVTKEAVERQRRNQRERREDEEWRAKRGERRAERRAKRRGSDDYGTLP